MSTHRPPEDPGVTCAGCRVGAETLPLGWSTSVERGRTVTHCADCSRAYARDMESKLDSQWWEPSP